MEIPAIVRFVIALVIPFWDGGIGRTLTPIESYMIEG